MAGESQVRGQGQVYGLGLRVRLEEGLWDARVQGCSLQVTEGEWWGLASMMPQALGGILQALPPVLHAFGNNKARCLPCPLPGQYLTLLGAFSFPVGNDIQNVSSQQR